MLCALSFLVLAAAAQTAPPAAPVASEGFAVSPSRVVLSVREGKLYGARTISVWSEKADLTYTIAVEGPPWLKVEAVPAKKGSRSRVFRVDVDPRQSKRGRYDAGITIGATGTVGRPVTIPLVIEVD